MKCLISAVLCLMLVSVVFAREIKVSVVDNQTNETLNETIISEEGVKAVEYYVYDFPSWIIEAANNKVSLRKDAFINENTDRNPSKLIDEQKDELINNTEVESRKDREKKEKK